MITVNLNLLDLKDGYRVLDIGCGSGRHMAAISHRAVIHDMKSTTVIGSDISLKDLGLAKERMNFQNKVFEFENIHKNWELISSDITNIPFNNNCFDLIICSEVLEHIYDDKSAIEELVRILKPGKILAISVPRYWPERIYWSLSDDYTKSDQKHVRIYRKKKLIDLLESYGLSCHNTHYSHSLHTLFWFLKCVIGFKDREPLLVTLYHNFLVWEMMKKPIITKILDKLLNPILGKSLVIYTTKIT